MEAKASAATVASTTSPRHNATPCAPAPTAALAAAAALAPTAAPAPAPAAAAAAAPANPASQPDPLKIIVTGYPPYSQPQDLTRVFGKFGPVTVARLNVTFAALVYQKPEDAAKAVMASKKINIYGEFLTVRPFTTEKSKELSKPAAKRDFSRSKQKGTIIEPKEIDLSGDVAQQLERLLAAVRLTQEEVAHISALYSDVEQALQPQWPGCTAIPFGSITTGLGVKSSDADCFVLVPPQYRHPHANHVQRAKRLLELHPWIFSEILSIPRANTPIVKFFHIPTETNCDLTFKTPLGAQNSKLVAALLHADARLVPLAVAVKYWAAAHQLSGTGKLTNYALTLLVLFYLQQPPLSIVPAVCSLQEDPVNDIVVDSWNTGFDSRKLERKPSTDGLTVPELLGGFFQFYSEFNFEELVVCPFLGIPVRKDTFKDMNVIPAEFQRYKANVVAQLVLPLRVNTAMCVQDPFEQCHNVASAISGKLTAELRAYFRFAADAYESEKATKWVKFLQIILLQKPKIVKIKSHPEYRVNLFPRIIVSIVDPDWKSVVRDLVCVIFEDMLKIKLGKVEEKLNPDSRKEKEKYMGHVTKAIWKRKQFSRLYSVINLGFQEKQGKITEEIIKVDKQVLNIVFQLTMTFCHDPRSSVISIKLGTGDINAFRDFGKFFISVMQGWFTILLKPHARPVEKDTAAKIAETIDVLDANMHVLDLDSEDEVPPAP